MVSGRERGRVGGEGGELTNINRAGGETNRGREGEGEGGRGGGRKRGGIAEPRKILGEGGSVEL